MATLTDLNAKRVELDAAIDDYKAKLIDYNTGGTTTLTQVNDAKTLAHSKGDEYGKLAGQVKKDNPAQAEDDFFSNPGLMSQAVRDDVRQIMRTGKADRPTIWRIDTNYHKTSAAEFTLRVAAGSNLEVDWGDGTVETITNATKHTYAEHGVYDIKFLGDLNGFTLGSPGNEDSVLRDVLQFGDTNILAGQYIFRYYMAFVISATDSPKFAPDCNLSEMFYRCTNFNSDIGHWDVTNVKSFWHTFGSNTSFNQDLSNWDVSGVQGFSHMLKGCSSFYQDLSGWDVSSASNYDDFAAGTPMPANFLPNFP